MTFLAWLTLDFECKHGLLLKCPSQNQYGPNAIHHRKDEDTVSRIVQYHNEEKHDHFQAKMIKIKKYKV